MQDFDENLLRMYAEALLRDPSNPYEAALKLTGDVQTSMRLAKLTADPEFIAAKDALYDELGEDYFLPTKSEIVREVLAKAKQCTNADVAFKGYKLAADMLGFIEKPKDTTVINNSLTDNRRVMVVQDFGSDSEWEKQVQAQQAKLIEDASRTVN